MKRIFDSLEKLNDKQGDMNTTLARLTTTVELHEKRSTNLEKKQDKLEVRVDKTESWIDKVKGAHKLILILATVVGLSAGIIKIMGGS